MSEPVRITSLDDPRVSIFRDVRDRDLRGADDLFMAESELVLRRLLRTPERLHSVLLDTRHAARLHVEIEAAAPHAAIYVAEPSLLWEIAGFHIHRGVLAAGSRQSARELSLSHVLGQLDRAARATVLCAEGITNVDNMGALFRNAAALGADAVVLDATCCDPLYRKAVRVSMGHVLSVPYAICSRWPDDLHALHDEGFRLIALETAPEALPLEQLPDAQRMALVLGSEGAGLSEGTLRICDSCCIIPMAANVPSVNIATAAAIGLYERGRRDRLS